MGAPGTAEARRGTCQPKEYNGRWPANVTIDNSEVVMAEFEKYGERAAGALRINAAEEITGEGVHEGYKRPGRSCLTHKTAGQTRNFGDAGTPARFFFCAKASQSERWFHCRDCKETHSPLKRPGHLHGHRKADGKRDWSHLVSHPTQKSVSLMRWLCRLITPPGGTILDAFCGSGSTVVAAIKEGFKAIGIDQDLEYLSIARARASLAVRTRKAKFF